MAQPAESLDIGAFFEDAVVRTSRPRARAARRPERGHAVSFVCALAGVACARSQPLLTAPLQPQGTQGTNHAQAHEAQVNEPVEKDDETTMDDHVQASARSAPSHGARVLTAPEIQAPAAASTPVLSQGKAKSVVKPRKSSANAPERAMPSRTPPAKAKTPAKKPAKTHGKTSAAEKKTRVKARGPIRRTRAS